MSRKEKRPEETAAEEQKAPETEEPVQTEQPAPESGEGEIDPLLAELEALKDQAAHQEDKYLRLAAEYDNYRRRTTKEKESIWNDAKADAASAFLPVYDNLERALKQETADEAYKKGVEMTMTQLLEVLESLDIRPIEAVGKPFDPNLHNAVMHVDDENFGENVVAACFQTGFTMGEKVIRFSMVQVAN